MGWGCGSDGVKVEKCREVIKKQWVEVKEKK